MRQIVYFLLIEVTKPEEEITISKIPGLYVNKSKPQIKISYGSRSFHLFLSKLPSEGRYLSINKIEK